MDLGFDVADLASLKRKDLQALAKKHGIKANAKSTEIIHQLKALVNESPSTGGEDEPSKAQAENVQTVNNGDEENHPTEENQDSEKCKSHVIVPPLQEDDKTDTVEECENQNVPFAINESREKSQQEDEITSAQKDCATESIAKEKAIFTSRMPSKRTERQSKSEYKQKMDRAHAKLFESQTSIYDKYKGNGSKSAMKKPQQMGPNENTGPNNQSSKKRKRPVFDLQASLAKKPTWKMYTGPIDGPKHKL